MNKKLYNRWVLLFLLVVASFSILYSSVLFWPQNKNTSIEKITVETGLSLHQIATILYNKKIINNKNIFSLAVKLLGKEKEIPVGTFKLVKANSNYEVISEDDHS